MESNKIYVDVNATFSKDGRLIPKSFIWTDGHVYEIQRVKNVCRAASLKAGGVGMRYTCVVDGRERQFLRYKEAEVVYSIQHKKLIELADEAGAIYKVDGYVLINRDIFDAYFEQFRQEAGTYSQNTGKTRRKK